MLPPPDQAFELVSPALLSRGARGVGLFASPMWRIDADDAYIGMEVQTDEDGNDIYLPSVVSWRAVPQAGWELRSKENLDRHERLKVPHVAVTMRRTTQPAAWWRTTAVDSLEQLVYTQDLRDEHSSCHSVKQDGEWVWHCAVYEADDPASSECCDSDGFTKVEYLVPAFALKPLTGKGAEKVMGFIDDDFIAADIAVATACDLVSLIGGACECVDHFEGHVYGSMRSADCVTDQLHCSCCDLGSVCKSMEQLQSGERHPVDSWSSPLRREWEALCYRSRKGWDICRSPSNESEMADFPIWKTNFFFGSSRYNPIRREYR